MAQPSSHPHDDHPTGDGSGQPTSAGTIAGPERMRRAVADYVAGIHAAYVRQARTLSPVDQARLPLLGGVPLSVAAVGVRHLHVIATHESLGPGQRGSVATVEGDSGPISWTLTFYDPIVVPALGLVDEGEGPAFDDVRRVLGIKTHLYHLTLHPQSGLTAHHAEHTGTGLANAHAAAARETESIERSVDSRLAPLAREFGGALDAGLPRAAALVARALAPGDETVAVLADSAAAGATVDPAALRRAVLHAVRPSSAPVRTEGSR